MSADSYPVSVTVVEGPLYAEVRQVWNKWLQQSVRLRMTAAVAATSDPSELIELEHWVDPIPIDDGLGKEVVVRFRTPIRSAGAFYTDSEGQEMQRRM